MRRKRPSTSILRTVFGPSDWDRHAAIAFKCGRRHARKLGAGELPLTRRHWIVLAAVVSVRKANLVRDYEARKVALDRELAAHLALFPSAETEIARQLELNRRARVLKGLE